MQFGQVSPDWIAAYTPDEMERELNGFKFKGPGFYLTGKDTLLIDHATEQGRHTVYCWNCRFEQTMMAQAAVIPNRLDDRE